MVRHGRLSIPRMDLEEGAHQCLSLATSRLRQSRMLSKAHSPTAAAVLFLFAVEEFGKAVLLRRAYDAAADPAPVEGFYDHAVKMDAATSRIGPDALRIGPAGNVSVRARLSGLYVDWDGKEWRQGVRVIAGALEGSRSMLAEAIQQEHDEWGLGPYACYARAQRAGRRRGPSQDGEGAVSETG
jgi:hypothetical protein